MKTKQNKCKIIELLLIIYEWMNEQTKDCFPVTTVYTYNNKKEKIPIDGLI